MRSFSLLPFSQRARLSYVVCGLESRRRRRSARASIGGDGSEPIDLCSHLFERAVGAFRVQRLVLRVPVSCRAPWRMGWGGKYGEKYRRRTRTNHKNQHLVEPARRIFLCLLIRSRALNRVCHRGRFGCARVKYHVSRITNHPTSKVGGNYKIGRMLQNDVIDSPSFVLVV